MITLGRQAESSIKSNVLQDRYPTALLQHSESWVMDLVGLSGSFRRPLRRHWPASIWRHWPASIWRHWPLHSNLKRQEFRVKRLTRNARKAHAGSNPTPNPTHRHGLSKWHGGVCHPACGHYLSGKSNKTKIKQRS